MAHVELRSVSKIYSAKNTPVTAVSDISFTVEDKTTSVLVGPSGCGKTTTLRMIAGLEEISGGTILIDGKPVNALPPKARDTAMVFQNYALYPHMSVFDNMAFGLRVNSFPKDEIKKRVHEAAAILQLTSYLERRPHALSGGQRQRVAVGRAIVRKPKIFLLDEPLSNLDTKLRVELRMELMKLRDELGWTMIYVTHDQVEAMTMADTMIVMHGGKIQQQGSPNDIYEHPKNRFVAEFIGTPAMNFLKGEMTSDLFFVSGNQRIKLIREVPEVRNCLLGIRPEHIEISQHAGGWTGQLKFVEHLGSENHLYFDMNGNQIIVRTQRRVERSEIGNKFFLNPAQEKMYFFGPDDGQRIY